MRRQKNRLSNFFLILIIGLIILALDSVSSAKPLPVPPKDDKDKKQEHVDIKQDDVVQFLETLEIFGRVEKPQTVFIIPGKDPRVDDIIVKREFFKEMFRTVEKPTVRSKQTNLKDTPFIPY